MINIKITMNGSVLTSFQSTMVPAVGELLTLHEDDVTLEVVSRRWDGAGCEDGWVEVVLEVTDYGAERERRESPEAVGSFLVPGG